jgi:WD40 repeat protein
VFAPDGKSWLYFRGRDVYERPLPVGTGPDRLFARLGAEVAGFWTYTDRLVVADGSGDTHVWAFPPGGLDKKVIPRPDTASRGMLADPSGRWLAGDPRSDGEIRLWDLSAWNVARPILSGGAAPGTALGEAFTRKGTGS